MAQENNIVIIFSKKAETALFDMEQKYNLEENDEEWIKKTRAGKSHNIKILVDLIRKLPRKEISEKDFLDSLKRELNLNEQISKNIFADTINNIIPYLKEIPAEDIEKRNLPKNIDEEETIKPIIKSNPQINITKPSVPKKRIKKSMPVATQVTQQQNGPDTYREPIE